MACCQKCGKKDLHKDSAGRRYCKRCGVARGLQNYDRDGNVMVPKLSAVTGMTGNDLSELSAGMATKTTGE
jgi:hypothetical protein